MREAVLVALSAAIGNFLQGWDGSCIAGAVLYLKGEFNLQGQPTIEGLIVSMSLIGATVITTFSGPVSDSLGRRPMMITSSVLYFLSALVMLWSPNVYVLLIGRLLNGFGVGIAVTLVPVYISETAPPEVRGLLNTFPQLTGSTGMFFSYCMVFGMSLMDSPSWRLILGVLSIPSILYFALAMMFLPESPRWLVSKGRMEEAKQVLQRLRGREDVAGEMALLVEGLSIGGETSVEEYMIGPANELAEQDNVPDKDQIKLFGANEGVSMVAKPVTCQSTLGMVSRCGSMANPGTSLVDHMVTLFGSVHEALPDSGRRGSMIFPTFGSMFNMADQGKSEQWDMENPPRDGHQDVSEYESDENLHSPLLSSSGAHMEKDVGTSAVISRNPSNLMQGESAGGLGIGGGWHLAYKLSEEKGQDGKKAGLKRIFLHQEGGTAASRQGSTLSHVGGDVPAEGECFHASALVSRSVLHIKDFSGEHPVDTEKVKPTETVMKGPGWADLCEPGVKHALVVGVGIQLLQQFIGINGVLYYTPQILQQVGVGDLISNLGIRPVSATFLISAFTTLLMLPSIGVAMRLMDAAGRRYLLLTTIPVLLASLITLVLANIIDMGALLHAIVSTISVMIYFCCFVMGFGPIPNILCSEIFPTRVRGLCIAICSLTFWISDIIVTYSLPIMLGSVGLGGVFGIYAIVAAIAWVFVFLKVPETKGMPLEVITEFFAVGAKQAADASN
ncbi:hypothetical protein NMG60_11026453 [Bertholletia excelsa]